MQYAMGETPTIRLPAADLQEALLNEESKQSLASHFFENQSEAGVRGEAILQKYRINANC